MAIDDNTLYGLTGAQVKELPEKIEAVKGKARVLTSADYNANSSNWSDTDPANFNCVALWKLSSGIYAKTDSSVNIYLHKTGAQLDNNILYLISATTGSANITVLSDSASRHIMANVLADGTRSTSHTILTNESVVDNLTSTSTTSPLSANQGKVLKDFIGDLTNLTTTDKTNLVAAINEAAAGGGSSYTAGDGIDITNDIISATNTGKAKVLTADDYNYPVDNPTRIALWLLPNGIYTWPYSIASQVYATTTNEVRYKSMAIVTNSNIDTSRKSIYLLGTPGSVTQTGLWDDFVGYNVDTSTGVRSGDAVYPLRQVEDRLTSTKTLSALSANQGKVLKDLIDSIAIRGAGAPTTSTVGEVGQLYEDGTNGALYQLKSIDITTTPNTYNWEQVGGSSVNVVQTTGTSTTDVMSQNAVTSMVFADPSSKGKVQIGHSSEVNSYAVQGIAIGDETKSRIYGGVAIGRGSVAGNSTPGTYSAVALGAIAKAYATMSVAFAGGTASTQGEFAIGTSENYGYNSSNYRLLTGLYDPQSAHDAATKGYVDTAVAGAAYDPTISNNTLYL